MEPKDIINIVLALYSLLLSSYLCFKKIQEAKRKFIFSHELETSFAVDNKPNLILKLYVNNGGEKILELTELGFFSKTGSIPIEKGDPKLAKLHPGESYNTSFNLTEYSKMIDTIKGYYAKDSFGNKHKYNLIAPLSSQFENSLALKLIQAAGFNIGLHLEIFEEKINEFENKRKEILNENKITLEKWRKEDLDLLKKYIEEESKAILSIDKSLKKLDRQRNNPNKYTAEELKVFDRVYNDTKELKEKAIRRKEELKNQYNDIKNKLI